MSGRPDYDAEYNNRARVPDHPSLIEGWARDAAAYRAERPPRRLAYGPGERQAIDLFEAPGQARCTALFIHGGYWQSLDPSFSSHLARGLNRRGVTVALPGYRLCPEVRVGEIVDDLRLACAAVHGALGRPLVVAGHSAGGHLAACMLASDWPGVDPALPRDLVPAAFAISGLFDLLPLVGTFVNGALGMDEAEAARESPLLWPPPAGRTLDAVVGGAESGEYLRQSRAIVERWGAAGAATRYAAEPGANHFTVIAPLADERSAMVERLSVLAGA